MRCVFLENNYRYWAPEDVNVFRNVILALEENGHEVKIVSRAKENIKRYLKNLDFRVNSGHITKTLLEKHLDLYTMTYGCTTLQGNFGQTYL